MFEVTYEVGAMEPIHPDLRVASRFRESGLGNCGFGCKIYSDPMSDVTVLAHNRSYGCEKFYVWGLPK